MMAELTYTEAGDCYIPALVFGKEPEQGIF